MTVDHRGGQRLRRDRAGRVARVHAGLLDVLHHPADEHLAGVRRGWRRRRPRWRPRGSGRSAPAARPTARPRGRGVPKPASSAIAAAQARRRRRRSAWPGRRARSDGRTSTGIADPRRRSPAPRSTVGRGAAGRLRDARARAHSAFHARGPRPGRSTPGWCRATGMPAAARPCASLSGVCPPSDDDHPRRTLARCALSRRRQTLSTSSRVSGSKKRRSLVS